MTLFARKVWNFVCKKGVRDEPGQGKPSEMQFHNIESSSSNPFECTLFADIELLWNFHWRTESKTERKKSTIPFTTSHFVRILCHWVGVWVCEWDVEEDKGKYRKCVASRYWFGSRCYCENGTLYFLSFLLQLFVSIFSSFFSFTMWNDTYTALAHSVIDSVFIVCLSSPIALTFSFLSANCYFSMASFLIVLETIALMCIETSEIHCWCSHTWHRWTTG